MEVMSPRPPQEFLLDSAGAGAYTPKSAIMNPFASTDDVAAAGNPFLVTTAVTAPPSPNPFEQLPPGADPFDLFQHFTSVPTSPARAAAIYAQFDSVNSGKEEEEEDDDDVGFQPRVSYSMSKPMATSTVRVPFDWEEKPGKPKAEFASVTTLEAGEMDDDDADFDFGVLLDKASSQAQELTTADELFDEGKIRPLKPPPRLLECASVGSSPRSARSVMWSPRLRSRLTGPGSANANFDPFAAALVKAANGPTSHGTTGAKHDASGVRSASSPMVPGAATSPPSTPPATNNDVGRKKWRLRDLLLFRRATKGRATDNISKDPVFKYAPAVQVQQLATPVKTATAGPAAANGGDASAGAGKQKKRSKKAAPAEGGGMPMPMPQRQNLMGCVRLRPGLHRLAKGFHGHSAHLGGRGTARSAT